MSLEFGPDRADRLSAKEEYKLLLNIWNAEFQRQNYWVTIFLLVNAAILYGLIFYQSLCIHRVLLSIIAISFAITFNGCFYIGIRRIRKDADLRNNRLRQLEYLIGIGGEGVVSLGNTFFYQDIPGGIIFKIDGKDSPVKPMGPNVRQLNLHILLIIMAVMTTVSELLIALWIMSIWVLLIVAVIIAITLRIYRKVIADLIKRTEDTQKLKTLIYAGVSKIKDIATRPFREVQ